jgi:3-dehydroquinate dehydratase-2
MFYANLSYYWSINPGAFGHYAHAIADALSTFEGPKVELHVSNPLARESWRHTSVIAPVVDGSITGLRADGYRLAIEAVAARLANGKGTS